MVRLEDSRILNDGQGMKKRVTQIQNLGENFIREQEIRGKNYKDLTAALKDLHIGVQNASRIRGICKYVFLNDKFQYLFFIISKKNWCKEMSRKSRTHY